jgi:hypothetical protein
VRRLPPQLLVRLRRKLLRRVQVLLDSARRNRRSNRVRAPWGSAERGRFILDRGRGPWDLGLIGASDTLER